MADKPDKARPDDDRLELDGFIPYRLSVMQQEVSRTIAGAYADRHGLMRNDWRVMAALGCGRKLSANEVCRRTNMDKVQVSRAIARLKRKGLVARQPDTGDRRRSSLCLTGPGERIYRDIVPAARRREAALLAVLSKAELEQLDALIDRLYNRARDLNAGNK